LLVGATASRLRTAEAVLGTNPACPERSRRACPERRRGLPLAFCSLTRPRWATIRSIRILGPNGEACDLGLVSSI